MKTLRHSLFVFAALVAVLFATPTPAAAQSYDGSLGTIVCDGSMQTCAIPAINSCMMAAMQNQNFVSWLMAWLQVNPWWFENMVTINDLPYILF